ncbi:hypothetical protein VTO42DRAFT_8431 [Malbranchea cinnamomea]
MAEENKPVEVSNGANKNEAAEKDVQNVLAELKAEEAGKKTEGAAAPVATEAKEDAEANGDKTSSEKKAEDADDEAKEEARIIAAAAKLSEEAVNKEVSRDQKQGSHGGRGGKRVNYSENVKTDFSSLPVTDDPVEIRKQVEFYFSDSNLPVDKFLLSKVGGSENRPVPLTLIHSFKRMRRFQPLSAIVAALKESKTLELTDNDTCVRRKEPLSKEFDATSDPNVVKVFEDKAMSRSIYAKGFGKEEPSTQFDIEAFFTPYGPLNAVRLRRTPEKIFKGSVFVEFDSEETQKKFLALDPKPKWKGETELIIKSKKEYCEEKVKEIEAGRIKPNSTFRGRPGRRGRGRGDRKNNDRDSRDQKNGFNRNGRSGDKETAKEIEKDARGVPVIQVSKSNSKSEEPAAQAGQKRTREDDAPAADKDATETERPAKKVDVKEG